MKRITVMIVDDSATMRNVLRKVLESDPDIEVVAQAVNGKLALPRIRHYRPEIVILDNEMPEMTGLETLPEMTQGGMMESGVIMFSSHTVEGARVTVRALELGALDFVTKPGPSDGNPEDYIRRKLISMIKVIVKQRRPEERETVVPERKAFVFDRPLEARKGQYRTCAIGISTGGPAALRLLLPEIPASIRGSILIVQHMPPIFTRQMAESLNNICKIEVLEATNGMEVLPGKAYIAPGGMQMKVEKKDSRMVIRTTDDPPENNCKPSVNYLFRSVADTFADRATGIIMTGMGNDGYLGLLQMKENGSYLIAQSQESCLVFGMPAQATREGLVHESLDIAGIANRIQQLLGTG